MSVFVSPFPRGIVEAGRILCAPIFAFGEACRRAMEEALEKESAAEARPPEGPGEDVVGTGRGLEGEDVCLCSDIAAEGMTEFARQAHSKRSSDAIGMQNNYT